LEEKHLNNIIEEVKRGNYHAFNAIIVAHENQAYNLAFRIVKNREDAEEIAQDSFVKAYKRIKSFKGDSKFSTWLYRIVYNNSINKLRANKKFKLNDEIENDQIGTSVSDHSMQNLLVQERKDFIKQALNKLNPQESTLITLYYQNECDLKEIEEITGVNKNNLKVQLHRARKRLEQHLKQMLPNELESIR